MKSESKAALIALGWMSSWDEEMRMLGDSGRVHSCGLVVEDIFFNWGIEN